MKINLLEAYGKQLRVAEDYVAKNHDGKRISDNTKLATAVLLNNTNSFLTESAALNTVGSATQRSDLGQWKRFCLNLTNLAVPSLIANDLVIVHPMTSFAGAVAYIKYVAMNDKGDIKQGTELNSVFGLGEVSEARTNYTSQVIVETFNGTAATLTVKANGFGEGKDIKVVKADGTVSYITAANIATGAANGDKIAYLSNEFQMESVPATAIPAIGPKMESIPLVAKPRRIAVKYDQITALQAKQDYGFSLDKQIAEQACGELEFEIDTEIIDMLHKGALEQGDNLTWSKTLPVGVSKLEHYMGFLEVFEQAKTIIYRRTKRFHPNYMVVAADVLQVIRFINGYTPVKNAKMNGPYKVGELDGVSIFVSPTLANGEFFFGLNGSDMMSSAGVYAPYMAIVPTMLLGTPDGALQQGFSTWYAVELLNKNLLVSGKIVD